MGYMNFVLGSLLDQPFWIVLLAFGVLALFVIICTLIDKARKNKHDRERANGAHYNFINFEEENVKRAADDYRKYNPNYDKVDLSKLYSVYYVGYLHYQGNDMLQLMFVEFTSLSVRGQTLIATYTEEIPGGLFHGPRKELHTIEMPIFNFNKNFFASKELAKEEVLRLIKAAKPNEFPYLYPEPSIFGKSSWL